MHAVDRFDGERWFNREHVIFMAAVRSRCGHYIFVMWFLLLLSSFFPRIISAVAEWVSTVLLYMVWP